MQVSVREVATREGLERLRPEWDALLEQAGDSSPFLRFEWIAGWWDHFGRGRRLFVLAAEDGEGLAGLAPFAISRYRYRGVPLRVLEFIGAPFRGRGLATRLDLVVARQEEQCLAGFAQEILARRGRWDFLSLRGVPAGSGRLERLGRLAGPDLALLAAGVHEVPVLPTGGQDWEQYLKGRSRSFRYWLRRTGQRAEKAGLGPVERAGDAAQLDGLLPQMARVCEASWKAAEAKGLFHPRDPSGAFLASFLRAMAEQKRLYLATLTAGGQAIAYQLAFYDRGVMWFYDTAFDGEYGAAAPGLNLFADMIQEGFGKGVERVDMGPGLHDYKLRWADEREARVHWMGFHGGLRSRVLHLGARWGLRLRDLKRSRGRPPQ